MRLILHNWNIACVALSSISVRAWRPATLDSNWAHSAAQGQESSGASLDQCQPPASLATEKFEKFNWTQLNPTKFELNWFYVHTNVHRISEHKEKLLQHPATFSFFAIIGIFEMKSLVDAVQFPNIQLLSLFSFHPFHHYFDHPPSTPIVLSHRAFLEKAARSKAKPEMRRACAQPRKAWTNWPTNPRSTSHKLQQSYHSFPPWNFCPWIEQGFRT